MSSPTLGQLLFSFFEDHLKCQKGLRPSSIKSYRDTMKSTSPAATPPPAMPARAPAVTAIPATDPV